MANEKPKLTERLKELFSEYGMIAVAIYLSTSVLVYAGTAAAMLFGFELEGVASTAGIVGAGFAAAKITQPPRILLTLLLTPLVARIFKRAPKAKAEAKAKAETTGLQ